jgi:hypothetical protein
MADSGVGAKKIQDEPTESDTARKEVLLKM